MLRRILLVDDDIAEIAAVKRVILRAGFHTLLATNSTDALAAVEEAAPEVVVVAPACESGEGALFARQLASRDATRHIPVVLLGAAEMDGIAAEVLSRPIDPSALDAALRAALLRSAQARSAAPRTEDSLAGPAHGPVAPVSQTAASPPTATTSPPVSTSSPTPSPAPAEPPQPGNPQRNDPNQAEGLERERRRHEAQVAQLERAAAEQEALRQLRRAGEEVRQCEEERLVLAQAARRSAEEAEIERAAAAEVARRRVLALARGRAAPASASGSSAGSADSPIPELEEGSLAAVSMPRLLAAAARGRATGLLAVACDPARSLWLEGGRVVGADSAAPSERAEEIALRLGLITREQHREVLPPAAGLASRRVGALLLERGFLKPTELALLARRHAEEIAFSLFTSAAGYRFEPDERVPADERLALDRGTLALAIEGVRRRWVAPQLEAVLGGAATLLAPAAQPPPVADLALSAEERRVLELADGLRTVDEILAGTPLDAFSTRQVLAGLVEVGALQVKIRGPHEAVASPPAGSIDLLRIDEKLEQVRRADYFTILGLGRACTVYEIREAAERLLSGLREGLFDSSAPGLAGKLEEIRGVLEEARDILSDDGLRGAYLASLGD